MDISPIVASALILLLGFLLDRWLGDPPYWPHVVVGYGKCIACLEKRCNRGGGRLVKGGVIAVLLIVAVYLLSWWILRALTVLCEPCGWALSVLLVFSCLAGRTLECEVVAVFRALEGGLAQGRRQLSRIVGRNTADLDENQVRTAALESLAENLSDGVVAPLVWYAALGVPGMMAYKMVNTLDSMVGYRNARYLYYGRLAAYIDDMANYLPARLTAYLILLNARGGGQWFREIHSQGPRHKSPNAGWPEAAMALVLRCRFGGPTPYGDTMVDKPYLGLSPRALSMGDCQRARRVALRVAWCAVILSAGLRMGVVALISR